MSALALGRPVMVWTNQGIDCIHFGNMCQEEREYILRFLNESLTIEDDLEDMLYVEIFNFDAWKNDPGFEE